MHQETLHLIQILEKTVSPGEWKSYYCQVAIVPAICASAYL